MRAIYTLTIFLGSALLFIVEPMVAKMILPVFGGSAAVWNASVVFFQLMLLAGYWYAHASVKWLGPKLQPWVHMALLAFALVALPLGLKSGFAPDPRGLPPLQVLGLLFVMAGLPFFVISAQAPLLQRWFAHTDDPRARDPYFLYSASNLGSMLALLAYPSLFETTMTLGQQSRVWTYGYAVLAVLTLGSAVMMLANRSHAVPEHQEALPKEEAAPPSSRERFRWLLLAAVPSSLMLGITSYLTTNVAPIPLLWIVPLALYLLTFIIAFSNRVKLKSRLLGRVASIVALPVALVLVLDIWAPMVPLAILHLLVYFILALACHSLLSQTRPSASYLTEFYLWLAAGGVLGGAFNAFFAPMVFNGLLEYPIALTTAIFLLQNPLRPARPTGAATTEDADKPRMTDRRELLAAVVAILAILLVCYAGTPVLASVKSNWGETAQAAVAMAMICSLIIGCFLAIDRRLLYGTSLGAVIIFGAMLKPESSSIVYQVRNFYGEKRVFTSNKGWVHDLRHGSTLHGSQNLSPEWRRKPITYYGPNSPVGQLLHEFSGPKAKKSWAVVGLGAGSLAAYGQPGQDLTYYEIDPQVIQIATNPKLFTFVADSRAKVHIIQGDARIELAKAPPASYGLIILDAFSSDAVPVHLLTREAVQMYLSKLQPGGVIAFHTSNRYLVLPPVIGRIAASLGVPTLYRDGELRQGEEEEGYVESYWMLMARNMDDFGSLAKSYAWTDTRRVTPGPIWTDQFSNVLSAVAIRDDEE